MAVPLVVLARVSETNKNNFAIAEQGSIMRFQISFPSARRQMQGMPFKSGPMFLHTPHSGVRLIAKVYRILRPKCDLRREKQGQRYSRASLFQAEARKSLFDLVFEVENRSLASKT